MWDPNMDMEKETKIFFDLFYGDAGEDMLKFNEALKQPFLRDDNIKLLTFMHDCNYYTAEDWVDIFLYKKRILQARLNIFLVMLCLGYYGVLALYIWLAKISMNVEWHILPYASFPLICMVLTLMATRRILKDEALVRAADRIR